MRKSERERETALKYTRIPINKCKRGERNTQSPLNKHHRNNWRRHDLPVKSVGKTLERNKILTVSKDLPQDIYWLQKEKIVLYNGETQQIPP